MKIWGGYCEPLIIRIDGREHYVLHEMHTYRNWTYKGVLKSVPKIKTKHSKLEFGNLEELMKEFKRVEERLGIDMSLPWADTDSRCGYDIPQEEFVKVYRKTN